MLNKKSYKNILIYLLFDKLKFSKIIYFNLRNYIFCDFFRCKLQNKEKEIKTKKKQQKNKEKKGNILKNKADIKKYKIKNRGL